MATNSKAQRRLKYQMRIKELITKICDFPHEFGSVKPTGSLLVHFPFPTELEESEVDEFGVYPSALQEIPEARIEKSAEISQTDMVYEDISEDDEMDVDEHKENGYEDVDEHKANGYGIRDDRKEVDGSTIQVNGTAKQGQTPSSSKESHQEPSTTFKRLAKIASTRSPSPYSDVSSSSDNEWQIRPNIMPYDACRRPSKNFKRRLE